MSELAECQHITVILASSRRERVPHGAGRHAQTTLGEDRIRAINEWMKKTRPTRHVYWILLGDGGSGRPDDGSHGRRLPPNPAGYAIMAPLAPAAIDKARDEPPRFRAARALSIGGAFPSAASKVSRPRRCLLFPRSR